MFTTSTLVSATLVFAAAIQGASAGFAINTPEFIQCQPAKISWAAAEGPYNLAVVNSNDPCGDVLLDLGDHTGTHITWPVTLEVGKQVVLSLLDSKDNEAWSGNITVQAGNDTSCLTGAAASSAAEVASSAAATSTVAPDGAVNYGTTLIATGAPVGTTTASQGSATAVGAANAGGLPNGIGNGSPASVHLSRAATVLGSAAAIFAVFAL